MVSVLTLCLPVSSADNLCKQFGPRSGPTIRVQTVCHSGGIFLKEFFKKLILKSADNKKA